MWEQGHGGEIVQKINRCQTREAARTTLKYFIRLVTDGYYLLWKSYTKGLISEILTRRSVSFQTLSWTKNRFAQIFSLQIRRKHVRSNSDARILNATFAYQKHWVVNLEANVALTMFSPDLLLIYCTFATYLPRANLSKSIFPPSVIQYSKDSATVAARYCDIFYGFQSKIF